MNNILYVYCSKDNIENKSSLHQEIYSIINKIYPKTILESVEFSEEFLFILIKEDTGSFSEQDIILILSSLSEINNFVLTHYRSEAFSIPEVNLPKDHYLYLLDEHISKCEAKQ